MYPIKANGVKVTSKFGKRIHPVTKKDSFHYGIDLIANPNKKNEYILAMFDGKVSKVVNKGSKGGTMCLVRIKHDGGYQTAYYHLKSESVVVKVGQSVKAGQRIATIGTTGASTGVHLHFQLDKGDNKTAIDPYDYIFKGKSLITKKVKQEVKYIVKKGDTLSKIAKTYKTTWQTIYKNNKSKIDTMAKKNGIKKDYQNYLFAGTELIIK